MGVKRHGHAIYRDPRWPALRIAAKRRDGWKCVMCGARGRLEVDHVMAIRDHGAAFDLANLQSLCGSCHARKTARETGIAPLTPERARWRDLLRTTTPKETPSCCKV